MRNVFLFLLFCFSILHSSGQLVIRNVLVVDVEKSRVSNPQDVLVGNGLIKAIGKKLAVPAGTKEIDGSGKWLMPGLVDAHIHFFQSGGLYARPDAIDLRKQRPYEQEIAWVHQNMESMVRRYARAGITSVIDVGATTNFLKQRDSFSSKPYATSIYMTGPLITTWTPPIYKDLAADQPFTEMKTVEDARSLVQQQLLYKPDFIKIWYIALGPNMDSSARANQHLVKAAIEEAHKHGKRVAVHATERMTAQLAVESGADYLVHGIDDQPIDASFVKLLKNRGVVLSPTLVVGGGYRKVFGQNYVFTEEQFRYAHPTPVNSILDFAYVVDTALQRRYKTGIQQYASRAAREDSLLARNLKMLVDGGVTIATGTDAGNTGTQHISSYFDELRAMQAAGMNTWQLMRSSTVNGARAVGREAEFGTVTPGKRADLLLLSKNPSETIENWKSIELVINKGQAFIPDSLLKPTAVELADQQLLAYNAHNLEAFLAPYAEDVEVYDLTTQKLQMKGKKAMREGYAFLNSKGKLHCKLLNRIVQDNIVVDHEEITTDRGTFYGVAIYEVKDGKIARVWFP